MKNRTYYLMCKECDYERDPGARMPSDGELFCGACGSIEWREEFYDSHSGFDSKDHSEIEIEQYEMIQDRLLNPKAASNG